MLGVTELELEDAVAYEIKEIKRRTALYRGDDVYEDCAGRQVVVVDDGGATGYTMFACLRSARNLHPKELILAVPVAPPDTLALLQKEVDHAVCLLTPDKFYAVGMFYEIFDQTCDEEVIRLVKELRLHKYQ
jgi:predicted phosphoribosyltransferase